MISKEKLASICRLIGRKSFAVCCGLAPIMLLIALSFTFKLGCNVIVDGKIIGTAESKEYVYNLIDSINEEFAPYFDGNDTVTVKPVTTPKLVYKGRFTSKTALAEALKSTCPYLKDAYCIKSNGTTVAAFFAKSERDKAYKAFIDQFASSDDESSYEILDDITFSHESVPYGLIKSGDGAVKLLGRTHEVNCTVKVGSKTSIEEILTQYNMTEEDFKALNPNYESGTEASVKISSEVPYIRVVTTSQVTEKQIVEYVTRSQEDDTMYEGETKLKNTGSNGFITTVKNVFALNGRTLCEVVAKEDKTEAIDEVLLVGTKKYSKGEATGSFLRPYSGSLSSRFGDRWGRQHNGIDLSGSIGDPISAADGGKVIYADWEDGYGYIVKIDHENGYITYYAHCSELYVSKGDKVAKGDVIAAVGSTGRSTGPHLHFEVRSSQSGEALDPLAFVDEEVPETDEKDEGIKNAN